MRSTLIKKITLFLLALIGISGQACAGDVQATSSLEVTAQSKAIEFARQAGAIAGVAQACGQNVSSFTQRIDEALAKISIDPTDKAGAMLIYQEIAREAQTREQKTQSIPCERVLQDYRGLPILQKDYQEKVIAQLNASHPSN
jgi:hypothetical protein